LLFIGLTVSLAWIGKLYILDPNNNQAFMVNVYRSTILVGQQFPIVSVRTPHDDLTYTNFSGKKGGLVLLFDPTSCQPCLELVLKGLQHLRDRIDTVQFPIYGISKEISSERLWRLKRAFKLSYQMGILEQPNALPDAYFRQTPLLLLIDRHNTILQCHSPIYSKEQFSVIFFTKLVYRHLPPLDVNIDGFKDSPLNKFRNVPLLDAVKGHFTVNDPFRDL